MAATLISVCVVVFFRLVMAVALISRFVMCGGVFQTWMLSSQTRDPKQKLSDLRVVMAVYRTLSSIPTSMMRSYSFSSCALPTVGFVVGVCGPNVCWEDASSVLTPRGVGYRHMPQHLNAILNIRFKTCIKLTQAQGNSITWSLSALSRYVTLCKAEPTFCLNSMVQPEVTGAHMS